MILSGRIGIWQREEVVHSLFPNTYINLNRIECRITWDIIISQVNLARCDVVLSHHQGRVRRYFSRFCCYLHTYI